MGETSDTDKIVSAFVRLRARGTALSPPEDLDPEDPQTRRTALLWARMCADFGIDPFNDPLALTIH